MAEEKEEKTFKDLGVIEQLVKACDSLGWKTPSRIQAEAIPHAVQGKDLIGLAQTGSGKTGAFVLPILQALLKTPPAFFACVLSPTRWRLATPGCLVDHLSNTKGLSLHTVKYLVLNEADRLVKDSFEQSFDEILNVIPRERKTCLFSATMTNKGITYLERRERLMRTARLELQASWLVRWVAIIVSFVALVTILSLPTMQYL